MPKPTPQEWEYLNECVKEWHKFQPRGNRKHIAKVINLETHLQNKLKEYRSRNERNKSNTQN